MSGKSKETNLQVHRNRHYGKSIRNRILGLGIWILSPWLPSWIMCIPGSSTIELGYISLLQTISFAFSVHCGFKELEKSLQEQGWGEMREEHAFAREERSSLVCRRGGLWEYLQNGWDALIKTLLLPVGIAAFSSGWQSCGSHEDMCFCWLTENINNAQMLSGPYT